MKFSEYLRGTTFESELVKALLPIVTSHMRTAIDDINVNYGDLGSEKEKLLKRIQNYYSNLNTVINDLDIVKLFLSIEDRKKIKENYPTLESQEEYYKYHFENYIIRLVTLSDIIGKMGNEIFEVGIDSEKCNGYNFKDKIKTTKPDVANIIERLLSRIKEIKDKRHQKIHTGETEINQLKSIIFWDELQEIIGVENNPILDNMTDKYIKEEIDNLETEAKEIIDIIKEFLEKSSVKVIEINKR